MMSFHYLLGVLSIALISIQAHLLDDDASKVMEDLSKAGKDFALFTNITVPDHYQFGYPGYPFLLNHSVQGTQELAISLSELIKQRTVSGYSLSLKAATIMNYFSTLDRITRDLIIQDMALHCRNVVVDDNFRFHQLFEKFALNRSELINACFNMKKNEYMVHYMNNAIPKEGFKLILIQARENSSPYLPYYEVVKPRPPVNTEAKKKSVQGQDHLQAVQPSVQNSQSLGSGVASSSGRNHK